MITIYTTPSCVYCRMAKEFFKENNLEYIEKNVATDDDAREEMIKKTGQLGVPVIEANGKIMVGFDKDSLKEALNI